MTGEKLHNFKESYQNSDEEKRDVIAAYTAAKGDMNKIFDKVMLSNPLFDESRFRLIIDNAIEAKEVEAFALFHEEPEYKKIKRQRRAAKESAEAMEYAKELGVYDTLFPAKGASAHKDQKGRTKAQTNKKEQKVQEEAGLAALIQKKNRQAKTDEFLNDLEAKYVGKKGKKRKFEEPPEELFQKNQQRKGSAPEAEVEDEEGEEVADRVSEGRESEPDNGAGEDDRMDRVKSKPAQSGRSHPKRRDGGPDGSSRSANKRPSTKKANAKAIPSRKARSKKA